MNSRYYITAVSLLTTPANKGISPDLQIAYDTSNGPNQNRLYAVYCDALPKSIFDSTIYMTYLDDKANATFIKRMPVTDGKKRIYSSFNPTIAVDPNTGDVGMTWYDTRDDQTNQQWREESSQRFGTFYGQFGPNGAYLFNSP